MFLLIMLMVALWGLWRFGRIAARNKPKKSVLKRFLLAVLKHTSGIPILVQEEAQCGMPKVFEKQPELVLNPLIVREIAGGMGRLIMTYRPRRKVCTGHLIIWSGKKKGRIQDSYYDLGMRSAEGIGEEIIDAFIQEANQKIDDLKKMGTRKRRDKKSDTLIKEAPTVTPEKVLPEVPAIGGSCTVSIEDNPKPEPSIKIKKHPSVFRGQLLEAGFMPKVLDEGVKNCFGVRYRTEEGVEDILWGVNLRTELNNAKAKIGDQVEIIKIGRKTVEEGKAPMNLYKVTKLSPEQMQ